MEKEIRLTPEVVRKIEEILTTGKTVEIAGTRKWLFGRSAVKRNMNSLSHRR